MIIEIDTKDWTQEQKNMMKAFASKILHEAGINYESLDISRNYNISIVKPSGDPAVVLTKENIENNYNSWKSENDVILENARIECNERKKILTESEFRELKIKDMDNIIDKINSIDDCKKFLNKFSKYVLSRIN